MEPRNNLWLNPIPPEFRAKAVAALEEGDWLRFRLCASNEHGLALVAHNRTAFIDRGCYEEALLDAFTATRTNNLEYAESMLRRLFERADRKKLRAAGDPLPGAGPFTVYRGVAGRGKARRVKGFSWTGSVDRARWFAHRFPHLADPAVFRVTIEEEHVLTYINGRQEDEYLILLAPSVKPERID